MPQTSLGIHHITAVASAPQTNVDFYTKILGLRLVKKSVNQDQVEAYHLFYGDEVGDPGMDLTFFTFDQLSIGRQGPGLVSQISLSILQSAFSFWQHHLESHQIDFQISDRFGLNRLQFTDPDGLPLEIAAIPDKEFSQATTKVWSTPQISAPHAIGYFHSARLAVISRQAMDLVLIQILGFQPIDHSDHLYLYHNPNSTRGAYLEIEELPGKELGIGGAGTVHHIAFQVKNQDHLLALRQKTIDMGLHPTEVIDRFYFKSVYFRTPAGILFELATNGPGFTVDEPKNSLGQTLKLPPWLEPHRTQIEANLEPIKL